MAYRSCHLLRIGTRIRSPKWNRVGSLRSIHNASEITSLEQKYKQAMGGVASSANIITTNHYIDNMISTTHSEPRGLTVSSLTSLSIKPQPMISFNLQIPSRTSQVLHDRGVFAINVVPASPEAKQLCQAFAGVMGSDVNPFERFSSWFQFDNSQWKASHDDGKGQPTRVDVHDMTEIPTVTFASAVLYCKRHRVFRVQDHEIWVANVYHIENRSPDSSTSSILYQNRCFHELGPEVE